MPAPTPSDLRAAALSDQASGSDALLSLLLPDIPGEPYGGRATQAQVSAVFNAIGTVFADPAQVRPSSLREAMRRWAASQQPALVPQPDLDTTSPAHTTDYRGAPTMDVQAILEDLALSFDAAAHVERTDRIPDLGAAHAYDNAAAKLRRRALSLPAAPGTSHRPDSPDATQAER